MGLKFVTITVMSGADDGRQFELHEFPVTLGRHPDDDVFLPHDRRVSRHHAKMTRNGDSFFVEDVRAKGKGSINGTYLNGHKVNTKTSISGSDILLLGTVFLRFDKRDDIIPDSSDNQSLQRRGTTEEN